MTDTEANSAAMIIPALNEAVSIAAVVQAALAVTELVEVVVVDNGSTDDTAIVAARAGARVVSEPRRGYGAACLAGALAAHSELLVFCDGDGSFDPGDAARLLAPLRAGQADLALGSRVLGAGDRRAILPHQRAGNWLATTLLRWLYGLCVTDLGPLRAMERQWLLELELQEMTYGWPVEMMVKAARRGARVVELPVSYRSRTGGASKVSGTLSGSLKAGYRILSTVLRHAH